MIPSKKQGLTLVEVLVALVVVATAVLIISYLAAAMRDMRAGQNVTAAMNFARTYIDTTRAQWSQKSPCPDGKNICTQYQTSAGTLPKLPAPSGFEYAVEVNVLSDYNTAGGVVVSCPKAAACTSAAGPADATYPQRRMTVTVTDTDNRDTVLAMNVTRVDIP